MGDLVKVLQLDEQARLDRVTDAEVSTSAHLTDRSSLLTTAPNVRLPPRKTCPEDININSKYLFNKGKELLF